MNSSEKYEQFKEKILESANALLEAKGWNQCIGIDFVQQPDKKDYPELKDYLRIGLVPSIHRDPLFPYEKKEYSYGAILLATELEKFQSELKDETISTENLYLRNRDHISAKILSLVEGSPLYQFALAWDDRRNQAQKGVKIDCVKIKEFLAIQKENEICIGGNKEVYFVGENGDGKSLLMMAIHLAFNGNDISRNEPATVASAMAQSLKVSALCGTDTNGIRYGLTNELFIDNFYAYGANRGLASSDKPDETGFMSLYSDECRLYHPIKLLTQTYLNEREMLQTAIPLLEIEELFNQLLDQKVEVKTTRKGVIFVEKGVPVTFDHLSDGFKNILIWVSDMIYRLQLHQPEVREFKGFEAVVMVDEIELHLHPSWQNDLVKRLRHYFQGIQFIFTTHSPAIIQGASDDAIIFKVYRDAQSRNTSVSEPYFKKDMTHMMYNTLVTSPLFGLESARISPETENPDTSDSYLSSRVARAVRLRVDEQKAAGKTFISKETIDRLIQEVMNEELSK